MQKTFECLTCKAPIKLERDQTNHKWKRFELDGLTEHQCSAKKEQHRQHQPRQLQQQESTLNDLVQSIDQLSHMITLLTAIVEGLKKGIEKIIYNFIGSSVV